MPLRFESNVEVQNQTLLFFKISPLRRFFPCRAVPCVQNVTEIKARHEHATVITWFSVHLADFLLASDWCVFNCWVWSIVSLIDTQMVAFFFAPSPSCPSTLVQDAQTSAMGHYHCHQSCQFRSLAVFSHSAGQSRIIRAHHTILPRASRSYVGAAVHGHSIATLGRHHSTGVSAVGG